MTYKVESGVLKKVLPEKTIGAIEDVALLVRKKQQQLTKAKNAKARLEAKIAELDSQIQTFESELSDLKTEGTKLGLDSKKEYDENIKKLIVKQGLKGADNFGSEWATEYNLKASIKALP